MEDPVAPGRKTRGSVTTSKSIYLFKQVPHAAHERSNYVRALKGQCLGLGSCAEHFSSGGHPFAGGAADEPHGPGDPHHEGQHEDEEGHHEQASRERRGPVELGVNVPAAFVVAAVGPVVDKGKCQVGGPVRRGLMRCAPNTKTLSTKKQKEVQEE